MPGISINENECSRSIFKYVKIALASLFFINYISSTIVPLYDLIFNQLPDDPASMESEDIRSLSLFSSQATFYTSTLCAYVVPHLLSEEGQSIPVSLTALMLFIWRTVGDDNFLDVFSHQDINFYQNYSSNFGIRWALTMSVIGLYQYFNLFIKSLSINSVNRALTELNENLNKVSDSLFVLLPPITVLAWIYSSSTFIDDDPNFAFDILAEALQCTEKYPKDGQLQNILKAIKDGRFQLSTPTQTRGGALLSSYTNSASPPVHIHSPAGSSTLVGSRMTGAYFFSANYLNAAVGESIWYACAEVCSFLIILLKLIGGESITTPIHSAGKKVKEYLDPTEYLKNSWVSTVLTILGTLIFARVLYLPQEMFDQITQPTNTTWPDIVSPCPLTPGLDELLANMFLQIGKGIVFVFCDFFLRLGPWSVSARLPESYPNGFIWCMLNAVALWNAVAPLAVHFGVPAIFMHKACEKIKERYCNSDPGLQINQSRLG